MHNHGLSDSCEICLRLFIRLGFFELLCERKEAPLQMHTNHCPFLNCDSSLTSLQKHSLLTLTVRNHSLLTLTRMKTINPNSPRANALHSTYNTHNYYIHLLFKPMKAWYCQYAGCFRIVFLYFLEKGVLSCGTSNPKPLDRR